MIYKIYDASRERFARRYPAVCRYMREHKALYTAFRILSEAAVCITYGMYVIGTVLSLFFETNGIIWLYEVLHFTVVPFTSFIVTTVVRKAINAPRPYERGIDPLVPKKTKGLSCPSRHTACVVAIALAWMVYAPVFGAVMIAIAVCIALSRIIAGVHYPLDVAFGAGLSIVIFVLYDVAFRIILPIA